MTFGAGLTHKGGTAFVQPEGVGTGDMRTPHDRQGWNCESSDLQEAVEHDSVPGQVTGRSAQRVPSSFSRLQHPCNETLLADPA